MKTLLHVCCGPCIIYPLRELRNCKHDITAYFFNPNIHPFKEFQRRLTTLKQFSQEEKVDLVVENEYGLTQFLREVVYKEEKRCSICYKMRMIKSLEYAKSQNFEAFTTTLLYSKYQNHNVIKELCESLADQFSIKFLYSDYREGWQQGIDQSIALNLYRQPYCGCIYSEQERYDKRLRKKNK